MTFIKFCGMTREQDVDQAIELGVDAVGLIFWDKSPRHLPLGRAARLVALLPDRITPVGVFVHPTANDLREAVERTGIRVAQIHGVSAPFLPPADCERWIARSLDHLGVGIPENMTVVLDAHDPELHGGTGRAIDWQRAAPIAAQRRVLLAGGLTPANVSGAIRRVRPYGVDVASGIEDAPGVKNPDAMRAFVAAVRLTDDSMQTSP